VKLGVEIGAHTRTHCNVAQLESDEQLEFEIAGSIQDVRQHLGTECNYFAFPFGKTTTINRAAVDLLRRLGCKGYCSAYGTFNWPGNFGFHIRRFHGDPSLQRIKNWLTLDKRHLIGNQNEDFEDIQSQLPEQLVTDLSLLPSEPNGR
jgi:peptidoglycan/xylan/chitin deacetylase (PgdA/CDA1 family)